jgi:hypothetical protein
MVAIVTLSVGSLFIRRPKLWRQRASASGDITLPRWKTPGHRQESGAVVPILTIRCQTAVAPLPDSLLRHRNVQAVNGFLSERGGPLWRALI